MLYPALWRLKRRGLWRAARADLILGLSALCFAITVSAQALDQELSGAWNRHESLAPQRNAGCERVGLRVHLTPRGAYNPKLLKAGKRGLEQDLEWLSAHVSEANRLFKPLKICFELSELLGHPSEDARMATRAQRTALGERAASQRGIIEIFIVDRLDDVDVADAFIRGVHWRDPADRERRRWIILSRIARPLVLAHELGHYFSLPHGRDPYSIMNKRPRAQPPYHERGFTRDEYQRMRRAWREMKRSGQLKARHR